MIRESRGRRVYWVDLPSGRFMVVFPSERANEPDGYAYAYFGGELIEALFSIEAWREGGWVGTAPHEMLAKTLAIGLDLPEVLSKGRPETLWRESHSRGKTARRRATVARELGEALELLHATGVVTPAHPTAYWGSKHQWLMDAGVHLVCSSASSLDEVVDLSED